MLEALRRTHLSIEFGADLVEKLIEPFGPVARGNRAHSTMTGVHRHGVWHQKFHDMRCAGMMKSSRQRGTDSAEILLKQVETKSGAREAGKRQIIFDDTTELAQIRKSGVLIRVYHVPVVRKRGPANDAVKREVDDDMSLGPRKRKERRRGNKWDRANHKLFGRIMGTGCALPSRSHSRPEARAMTGVGG